MLTLNTILKELKNVPVDRLEDLYAIIHAMRADTQKASGKANPVLSFAGTFSSFSEVDYNDFIAHTQETRTQLFDRNFEL